MNRKFNWVCFDCQSHFRCSEFTEQTKCSTCSKLMICIGCKWRIPKKNDKKAWKYMQERVKYRQEKGMCTYLDYTDGKLYNQCRKRFFFLEKDKLLNNEKL